MKAYPENTPSSIRHWAESDRPREKLMLKGKSALSDAELMAILLGSGSRNESAVDLSRRILSSIDHNLIELSKMTVSELQKFKGIGEAKAITIVAALELGRRRRGAEVIQRKSITSSREAFELLQLHLSDMQYEQFVMVLLNRANHVLKVVNVSDGGVSGTFVDPKKVFRLALEGNASSVILGHNHPSGNCKPSDQDLALTKKLKSAGNVLDIAVLDHLIVGTETYFSFADEGVMPV
jgi:DNA repair protein RadC